MPANEIKHVIRFEHLAYIKLTDKLSIDTVATAVYCIRKMHICASTRIIWLTVQ